MSSTHKPHTHEDRLPPAHSLRESADTDNTLEGYAAMNEPPADSEIVKEVMEHPTDLHHRIAQRAYELYLERGGEDGSADEDWQRAEQELRGSAR